MSVPLSYVRDLMEKNYEAVGFIPLPRLEDYAERGQILTQYENDDPYKRLSWSTGSSTSPASGIVSRFRFGALMILKAMASGKRSGSTSAVSEKAVAIVAASITSGRCW
jgi:hypothetical protein